MAQYPNDVYSPKPILQAAGLYNGGAPYSISDEQITLPGNPNDVVWLTYGEASAIVLWTGANKTGTQLNPTTQFFSTTDAPNLEPYRVGIKLTSAGVAAFGGQSVYASYGTSGTYVGKSLIEEIQGEIVAVQTDVQNVVKPNVPTGSEKSIIGNMADVGGALVYKGNVLGGQGPSSGKPLISGAECDPSEGATGATLSTQLRVVFNQAIEQGLLAKYTPSQLVAVTAGGTPLSVSSVTAPTLNTEADYRSLIITLADLLPGSSAIQVTVKNKIFSKSIQPIDQQSYSFTSVGNQTPAVSNLVTSNISQNGFTAKGTITDIEGEAISRVDIVWSTNQNADPNTLYLGSNKVSLTGSDIGTFQSSGKAVTATLTQGQNYYWWARATDGSGTGSWVQSSVFTIPSHLGPTVAPTISLSAGNGEVTATVTNAAAIAASCSDGATITGYEFWYSFDGATFQKFGATQASPSSITGLTNDHQYSFKVNAVDSQGADSPESITSTATPTGAPLLFANGYPKYKPFSLSAGSWVMQVAIVSDSSGGVGGPKDGNGNSVTVKNKVDSGSFGNVSPTWNASASCWEYTVSGQTAGVPHTDTVNISTAQNPTGVTSSAVSVPMVSDNFDRANGNPGTDYDITMKSTSTGTAGAGIASNQLQIIAYTGSGISDTRVMLAEQIDWTSAKRIIRWKMQPLCAVNADEVEMVILPTNSPSNTLTLDQNNDFIRVFTDWISSTQSKLQVQRNVANTQALLIPGGYYELSGLTANTYKEMQLELGPGANIVRLLVDNVEVLNISNAGLSLTSGYLYFSMQTGMPQEFTRLFDNLEVY